MSTFDIRQAIAEIPSEAEDYRFTFDLKLARKVRELRAGDDEEALAAAEAELKSKTYTAEMMSVPRRRRDDIYEESIEKFPGNRDFLGRVDEKTNFQRGTYARIAIVAAAIKRIVSPDSGVQDENMFEVVEYIHDNAPDQIFEGLETKTKELNDTADEQEELNKSADF